MSRDPATLAYIAAIVWLFVMDRTRRPMTSAALWIPVIWWSILASRPITFWTSGGFVQYSSPGEYQEGSPLDAAVFLFLLCAGIVALYRRGVQFGSVFASNTALCVFMMYCLVSVAWSEFPAVAVKRWVKDCGNIVVVLVVLTEADPRAAIRAVLARCAYLTIPTSVLLIKYWSEIGRYYDQWTWTPMYGGVTTDKNALGAVAMLSALFLLWDLVYGRRATPPLEPPAPRRPGPPAAKARPRKDTVYWGAQVVVFGMALWLLHMANSSNALVCFMLGTAMILVLGISARGGKRLIRRMGSVALLCSLLGIVLLTSSSVTDLVLGELGEDATLTGRTDLWADVLSNSGFTLFGTGYQSFWLGSFAQYMWEKYYFHPNQAHNGYIETYLNGGWISLLLLVGYLLTAAARLRSRLLQDDAVANLLFAFLVVTLFYNISEAVFNRMSPVWLATLLAGVSYVQTHPRVHTALQANTRVRTW
jgi:exopolysaccharide production protein ExoQ